MKIGMFTVGGPPQLGLQIGQDVVSVAGYLQETGAETSTPGELLAVIQAGPAVRDGLEELSDHLSSGTLPDGARGTWWWPAAQVRFTRPFLPPKNPWTVGSNYAKHIEIAFKRIPREFKLPALPEFFTKSLSAVCGDSDDIEYDKRATQTIDYENELMVVIGHGGKDIPIESAMDHVFGFAVSNDVSARELQLNHGQFHRGKSLQNFCPFGPVIATRRELPSADGMQMRTWVNGVLRQDWPVGDMVFKVDELVMHLSRGMTIEPGDVIICGTGPGVGFEVLPQRWLQHGDVVECEISGIGRIRNTIKMAGV